MKNFSGTAGEIRPLLDDPLLIEALDYWESIRPDGASLPRRSALDPMAVPTLLPTVLLIDVMPDDTFVIKR